MNRSVRLLVLALVMLLLVTACSTSRTHHRRSNLMAYIYPDREAAPEPNPAAATLQLPLKIGVAFVPAGEPKERWIAPPVISSAMEAELLETVRRSFTTRDWVESIEIIPSAYLMPGGGFENLDQVAQMFGVEVVALASIDQLQHSDPTPISFLYLSVIGAHVLPLDRNDTRTLVDVAVFHVPSRTFLLRAPGQSLVKGRSTAVSVSESLRESSVEGFRLAFADVAGNLDHSIEEFKARLRSGDRKDVEVITAKGESIRSGSFSAVEIVLAALVLALGWRRRA